MNRQLVVTDEELLTGRRQERHVRHINNIIHEREREEEEKREADGERETGTGWIFFTAFILKYAFFQLKFLVHLLPQQPQPINMFS